MALQEWQERVVAEKSELDAKIKRLDEFICDPDKPLFSQKFLEIDADQRTLLRSQLSAMETYSNILARLIELF